MVYVIQQLILLFGNGAYSNAVKYMSMNYPNIFALCMVNQFMFNLQIKDAVESVRYPNLKSNLALLNEIISFKISGWKYTSNKSTIMGRCSMFTLFNNHDIDILRVVKLPGIIASLYDLHYHFEHSVSTKGLCFLPLLFVYLLPD